MLFALSRDSSAFRQRRRYTKPLNPQDALTDLPSYVFFATAVLSPGARVLNRDWYLLAGPAQDRGDHGASEPARISQVRRRSLSGGRSAATAR